MTHRVGAHWLPALPGRDTHSSAKALPGAAQESRMIHRPGAHYLRALPARYQESILRKSSM